MKFSLWRSLLKMTMAASVFYAGVVNSFESSKVINLGSVKAKVLEVKKFDGKCFVNRLKDNTSDFHIYQCLKATNYFNDQRHFFLRSTSVMTRYTLKNASIGMCFLNARYSGNDQFYFEINGPRGEKMTEEEIQECHQMIQQDKDLSIKIYYLESDK